MVGRLFSLVLLVALIGCGGARAPARDATYGFLDALENPPQGDRLARDLRTLLERYLERALAAAPPKDMSEIIADISGKVIDELAAHTPEQRRIVTSIVSAAVDAAFTSAGRHLPSLAQTSSASKANQTARGTALGAGLGDTGQRPIEQTLERVTEEATGAVVRGATAGLRAEVASCEGDRCGPDLVRTATRSAVVGAIEGVGRSIGVWLMAIAFLFGAVLALGVLWLSRALRRRPVA
ncbi:MAG: hypothetical protein QM820_04235 [Minicystis sp.]